MFDPTSRYYKLETGSLTTPDGRTIAYQRRRFLPRGEDLVLMVEVTVSQGERLDQIAARTLSDPLQFWQICDANNAMNPFDLTSEPGRILRVSMPQVGA